MGPQVLMLMRMPAFWSCFIALHLAPFAGHLCSAGVTHRVNSWFSCSSNLGMVWRIFSTILVSRSISLLTASALSFGWQTTFNNYNWWGSSRDDAARAGACSAGHAGGTAGCSCRACAADGPVLPSSEPSHPLAVCRPMNEKQWHWYMMGASGRIVDEQLEPKCLQNTHKHKNTHTYAIDYVYKYAF